MRRLPFEDPGQPDLTSPGRFLRRIARLQARTLAGGVAFGVLWMVCQAVVPYVIGRAIDEGLRRGDTDALRRWVVVLSVVGAVQAASGVTRHRFAVTNWLVACFRVESAPYRPPPASPGTASRSPTGSSPASASSSGSYATPSTSVPTSRARPAPARS